MYEKQTWKNGDVITEDKLNHIEDGIATGGGMYVHGETIFFNGEVTTVDHDGEVYSLVTLSSVLPEADVKVQFNDSEYVLKYDDETWGEDSYYVSINPVYISLNSSDGTYNIFTSNPGTYSLKIYTENIEVSDEFSFPLILNENMEGYLDKTWKEIYDAVSKNIPVLINCKYLSLSELRTKIVLGVYDEHNNGTSVKYRVIAYGIAENSQNTMTIYNYVCLNNDQDYPQYIRD